MSSSVRTMIRTGRRDNSRMERAEWCKKHDAAYRARKRWQREHGRKRRP